MAELQLPNSLLQDSMKLVDQMTDEELNLHVDYIRTVLGNRRRLRNAQMVATVKVGDKVRLTGNYKPKYLIGLTGVVTEKIQTRVKVKLDHGPVGKFRQGTVTTAPSGLTVLP